MPRTRPIVLTCGEPAGVGFEITANAWRSLRKSGDTFFFLGDADQLQARVQDLVPVSKILVPEEAAAVFANALPVLHRPLPVPSVAGEISPATAPQVIGAIEEAVDLAFADRVGAIVTNPIQKEALYAAGFRHQGHTDFLAALAREKGHHVDEVMMLVAKDLRTVPVTVHIPLAEVPKALTSELIIAQGRVVAAALKDYFGIATPRLAVTGLNPHAGENGTMGTEEITIIAPALRELAAEGISVFGPISADTAFHEEARATYDAVLCMYHDQALIPVKTLDFHGGVNVSLGLPFIRTSPDHGTALGLAGKGLANPSSLIASLRLAAAMAKARHG